MVSRLALALSTLLLATACTASPTPTLAPAFSWAIYNRTEAVVAVGPVMGLAPCASTRVVADQTPAPGATVMPSAIPLSGLSFRTPLGYRGVVSVVVASDGMHVTIGEIDPASLPACQGQPQL